MVDIRDHPEQDGEHEGASKGELLIEAARRNNTDLLKEVLETFTSEDEAAKIVNETKTVMGNYIYHEAALRGNYEIIDALLDIPGFECDPISRVEGDSPLHSAVRYINTHFSSSPNNPEIQDFSKELITMMIEAGSSPTIKNSANLTALQLVDPRNEKLKELIQGLMDVEMMRGDLIVQNDDYVDGVDGGEEDGEEGDVGSGSDSDFDVEEYRKEKERRKAEKSKGGA